jgi:hypothetical protein
MIRFLSLPGLRRLEPLFNLDVALRYLPVADRLAERAPGRLLEVGPGARGVTAYFAARAVGVEPAPLRPGAGLTLLAASGAALPFRAGAFETVVSVDVLEHVPAGERSRFLEELLRVAARRLILVFPSGERAAAQDRSLAERYRRIHGRLDQSLAEHLQHGLPDADAVRDLIERGARRPLQIRAARSLNLGVRAWIMRRWMSRSVVDLVLYRLGVLLVPLRRWLDVGGCYRVILDVSLGKGRG